VQYISNGNRAGARPGAAASDRLETARISEKRLSGLGSERRFTSRLKMTDNQTLVVEYVRTGSEPAFRELVARYVDLVYSSALRLVGGDAQLAEDVSQTVFLNLARKAHRLPQEVMLGGWLHRDTCYAARTLMRSERRRQQRERHAMEMNALEDHSQANLATLAPLLDEAIEDLGAEDRTAILLRFFEQRDFRAIGHALGSNEDAARKRVTRAVEKLHGLLKVRGVSLSAAALGTVLATGTITAAPAGLAASLAGTALAGAVAGAGFSATLIKLATMTKIQAGVVGAVVMIGAAATVVVQHQAHAAFRAQDESLRQQSAELSRQQVENERLAGLVQTSGSRANTLDDLASLRNEVDSLRKQTNSLAASLEEKRRLQARTAPPSAGSTATLEAMEEDRRLAIAGMNYTKQWLLAFLLFSSENHDSFPGSFDEAQSFLPKPAAAETNFTTGQFEILYQGPITNITSPALTVVMRQKQPRHNSSGRWSRTYGFADGHCEVASTPDGNYDAWEKQHIVAPSPDR
jgi:RNA polymerase sigma factor (sigma-70 family)